MLPATWALLDESSRLGVKETVIGMAHRGRTNLLVGMLQVERVDVCFVKMCPLFVCLFVFYHLISIFLFVSPPCCLCHCFSHLRLHM
jgi:hypothetical protein